MEWRIIFFLLEILFKYIATSSKNKIFLLDEENKINDRTTKNRMLNQYLNCSITQKAILNKFIAIDNSLLFNFPSSSNSSQIVSYDLLMNSQNNTIIQQNVCNNNYTYNLASIQYGLLVAFSYNQTSCLTSSLFESNNMIIFSFPNLQQVRTIFSVFKPILINLPNYTSINVVDSLYINNTDYQRLVVFTKAYDQSK